MFTAAVVDDDDNRVARGSQESRFAVFWIFPVLVPDLLLVLRVDIVDIDVVVVDSGTHGAGWTGLDVAEVPVFPKFLGGLR